MEISELYQKYLKAGSVSTDTRKIEKGTIFFALKGANFNGNVFAEQALASGASYAVIDEAEFKKDERYVLVKDVLTALQDLANFHRRKLNIPVLAITGSNGKTTSKELINAVLSKKFKTYATKGNLNNHIGIPLTLLAIKEGTEMAVVEMGANHQKEIEGYCKIAEPDFGIITNIGKAHLEGFGGEEGVKKGKGELFDYLYAKKGKVFVNTNDEKIKSISIGRFSDAFTYPNKGDYYQAELVEASPYIKFKAEGGELVETHLIGAYNFNNIAAALTIGKFFKVPAADANAAVAAYNPDNNRSQVVKSGSNTLILDAYNANPSSMKAAVENFAAMKADKKQLVLGDMFELGEESEKEHRALGKLLASFKFDKVILCGKWMAKAKEEIPAAEYYEDKKQLEEAISKKKPSDSTILIKGSRGMGLESLVPIITGGEGVEAH